MPAPFDQEQTSILHDALALLAIGFAILVLWGLIALEALSGAHVPFLIYASSALGTFTVGANLIHLAFRQIHLEIR